jgi:hypothetical protein
VRSQHVATDPLLRLFDAISGYQRTGALRAAVELDLFTTIAAGTDTVPALAACCRAAERGIRILCDTLTAHGFLRKDDWPSVLADGRGARACGGGRRPDALPPG